MVNFWSISMLLVLLEPVNPADSKYVCIVWIANTGDIYRGFVMSRKMSFGAYFYADFFKFFGGPCQLAGRS